MELDQQIQVLIDNAPQDGQTPRVVEAIAPILKLLASELRHSHYYILQTLNRDWVLTILSNRANPGMEKRVVYAFPTLEDVTAVNPSSLKNLQVMAIPVPVIHILFQMTAMKSVDSVVFFETPGNSTAGTEVRREDVQNSIQSQLQQYQSAPRNKSTNLPHDIA